MSEPVLTILGATGYSGRLVAVEAVRTGVPVRLAGRRLDALQDLAGAIGGAEVAVVDVADDGSLTQLAQTSDVLLSCVGPYERMGRPVVEAALRAQTPYADITGEVGFLRWVYEQDAWALEAGVPLLPGVGFDGIGELAAALAATRLPGGGARVDSARVAYATSNTRVSRGTARSALGVLAGGLLAYRDTEVVVEPAGARAWNVAFPPPFGRLTALSAPLPEGLTLGRSLGADTAHAYFAVPVPALGRAVPPVARAANAAARLLAATPAWSLLNAAVDRLPEGPSEQSRRRSAAAVVAEVRAGRDVARACASLSDVYGATARIAVAYARRLLADEVKPGAQTPAQAAPPADILDEAGASFAY